MKEDKNFKSQIKLLSLNLKPAHLKIRYTRYFACRKAKYYYYTKHWDIVMKTL